MKVNTTKQPVGFVKKLCQLVSLSLVAALLLGVAVPLANASASPDADQTFSYTIVARGTQMREYYPNQYFSWMVTTNGTETWVEHGVLLGELTVEQWGYAENGVRYFPAPANSVITRWSYTQHDLGWDKAQGWDTGTYLDTGSNQLVIKFYTGGTFAWVGGYKATYRIYGDRYHYDPVSKTQSGGGAVNAAEGDKLITSFSLAPPSAKHGGTVTVDSRAVTDTNARVTTRIDETAGKVYASTSYFQTYSASWVRTQTGSAAVNIADDNKYITTSPLAAPNGATTWTVTDSNAEVDTWMEGDKLYARVLTIADKPFNYTIRASGTRTVTTYPDQYFNWTVTTNGTETWVEYNQHLSSWEFTKWGNAEHVTWYMYPPANTRITSFNYTKHDLGWDKAQGWDEGSYIDWGNNRLVIKFYTGGTWLWKGGYWATYRIYGERYHYDPVSMTQSGSGTVNATEGDKFISDFNLAAPPAQHGGTVAINSRTITDHNPNVATRIDEALGDVYASTSYSVTNTYAWGDQQTGASAANYAEGDKYITTSHLTAPDGNTTWTVIDNNDNVNTWMVGNQLYAHALNLAPESRDDADFTTYEDTPLVVTAPGVLSNDYDPEGESISAAIVSGPSNGSLTLNADGSFTYAPNPNYSGTDSFTYKAKDIWGQWGEPATVNIAVTPVNDLPTISSIANQTISEDGSTGAIPFTIGDVETPPSDLTLIATSSNPTLVPNDNIVFGGSGANRTLTVTPAPDGNGTATITVSVTDADGGEVSGSFSLTVTAVNDLPTISDIVDQATDEDTPAGGINFIVGDAETAAGDLTVVATSSNPALVPNGNIVLGGSEGNRALTITPAPNQSGTTHITMTVSDGAATTSDSFVLTVNEVNDLPTISNIPNQTIDEDAAADVISFTVSDEETPTGSLIVSASSSDPTLVPNESITLGGSGENRTLQITPPPNQNGTGVIAIWVEDADGGKVYDNFVLTVHAVNDVPSFTKGADQTLLEDAGTQTVGGWATAISAGPANESDQTLTFIVSNNNSSLFAEQPAIASNGTLTYTSAPNANGSAVVTVKLQDSGGTAYGGVDTSGAQSFAITVTLVNDAPTVASPIADVTADEDAPDTIINLAPVFADVDIATNGDSLTYVVTANSNPTLLSASSSGSGLTLHYEVDENGSATITIRATDSTGLWAEDSFEVTVNPVNDPPVSGNDTQTTTEDTLLSFAASSLVGNDRPGPSNEGSQTLMVTAVSATSAQGGTMGLANGAITYTPAGNFNGTDSFTYTVTDNGTTRGAPDPRSTTGAVTVTVTPANDPPVLSAVPPVTIDEGSSVTVSLDSIVSDVETPASQMTWSATSSNTGVASVSINPTTRVVTITGVDNGATTITLTATDRGDPNGASGGAPDYSKPLSTSITVAVSVNNVAPVVSIDTVTDDAGQIISVDTGNVLIGLPIDLTGSFTDVGSQDTHTASVNWGDGKVDSLGSVTATSSMLATHTYTASGTFTITLSVTDDDTGTGLAALQVVVLDPVMAITQAIDDLTTLANDAGIQPAAAAAISGALADLKGNQNGRASNGALDLIQKGNFNAGLQKIKQAIQRLEDAEAADPSLDLTAIKRLLALTAKSVAVAVIAQAEAAATSPADQQKVDQAKTILIQGQALLEANDFSGAANEFQDALRKAQDVL